MVIQEDDTVGMVKFTDRAERDYWLIGHKVSHLAEIDELTVIVDLKASEYLRMAQRLEDCLQMLTNRRKANEG